jgi:Fe-S-cluster containining protein
VITVRSGAFSCNGCGYCCRHLTDGGETAWPSGFESLAPFGLYMLPGKGGLTVWSRERKVMLREARRRKATYAFRPSLAALDGSHGLVVFAWEAEHEVCPFVGDDNRCGIYEHRPTACRAYPLRFRAGGWTASESCDAAITPPDGDWPSAYADCMPAALAARRAPSEVVDRLQRLEGRGLVKPVRGLGRVEVAKALARGRMVDVVDLAGDDA